MYGQKETDLELGEQWMRVAAELGTTPHSPIISSAARCPAFHNSNHA